MRIKEGSSRSEDSGGSELDPCRIEKKVIELIGKSGIRAASRDIMEYAEIGREISAAVVKALEKYANENRNSASGKAAETLIETILALEMLKALHGEE